MPKRVSRKKYEGHTLIDENIINELVKRKVVSDTFRRLNSEKKEKLYKAALVLFGKYGYDGLSVEQYCIQARISKGSFFQYFPSKTHLLEFTLLLFDNRVMNFFEQIRKQESKVLAKDRLFSLFFEFTSRGRLDETEKVFYLFAANALYHSAVTVEGINISRHLNNYVGEIVNRGTETGEIRADIPPVMSGQITAGWLGSFLNRYFLNDSQPDESAMRSFISILFDGLKA